MVYSLLVLLEQSVADNLPGGNVGGVADPIQDNVHIFVFAFRFSRLT